MNNRLGFLIIILIEAVTLFCLGVLGNQVATLFTVPTGLLIICCVLGIVAITAISYLKPSFHEKPSLPTTRQSEPSEQNEIPQTQELGSREPRYSGKQIERRFFLGVGSALILGTVAMFLHRPFAQAGHSSKWFLMLMFFWAIASSPILVVAWRDTTSKHGCLNFVFAVIHTFMVGMLMLFGLILGLVVLTGVFGIPNP